MLKYMQETGEIFLEGVRLGTGYSGFGAGRNNPDMEGDIGLGPIPKGAWKVSQPPFAHPTAGPEVFRLSPIGHDAHGRTGFLIHGDNVTGTASHGCIILSRAIRDKIAAAKVTQLEVV